MASGQVNSSTQRFLQGKSDMETRVFLRNYELGKVQSGQESSQWRRCGIIRTPQEKASGLGFQFVRLSFLWLCWLKNTDERNIHLCKDKNGHSYPTK
jgi:hypothetical protein